jgi:exopolyphosphatase / guanosine-5'-triphosphate,3'-diphosphate pyrophosphatase
MSGAAPAAPLPPAGPTPGRMTSPAPAPGPGGRIAVVDIGSNSIRLVIYDRLWRAPVQQFNEKILCGLGRHLATTGRLGKPQMAMALTNLVRFVRLAEAMRVVQLDLLATEAVRSAENGPEFVAEIERRCGRPVKVLTGAEEARLAAQGVLAGNPLGRGLMGDLGGASLELARLEEDGLGATASLPLGSLRLIDAAGRDLDAARRLVDAQLAPLAWAREAAGLELQLVGGAWRSLARLQMARTGYPLHVIHGYALFPAEAQGLIRQVTRQGRRGLAADAGVSRKRIETLPMAAVVLERLIEHARPGRITFSAYGLREGWLFDRLPAEERRRDPLIDFAADLARQDRRFDDLGDDLLAWTDPLFPGQAPAARRLRHAGCHLSDIAWREHPDYRAGLALLRLLLLPAAGVDHLDRAFIAYAGFIRYGGTPGGREAGIALGLLGPDPRREAEVLGRALALAYALSGGTSGILARTRLVATPERLQLLLPDDGSVPAGEAVDRRLRALAKARPSGSKPSTTRIRYRPAVAIG